VAALALPLTAFCQSGPATDDASEALHNIQDNFAHMTPPRRTVDSINQELKQGATKSHAAGMGRHGGGRRGSKASPDDTRSVENGQADTGAPAPAPPSGGMTQ